MTTDEKSSGARSDRADFDLPTLEAVVSSSLAPQLSADRLAGRGGILTGGLVDLGEMLFGDDVVVADWAQWAPVGLQFELEASRVESVAAGNVVFLLKESRLGKCNEGCLMTVPGVEGENEA